MMKHNTDNKSSNFVIITREKLTWFSVLFLQWKKEIVGVFFRMILQLIKCIICSGENDSIAKFSTAMPYLQTYALIF